MAAGKDARLKACIDALPESAVASLAGTGNPFALGDLLPGEQVVHVGSGAGVDSLIAASLVGPSGAVIGMDMTPEMLQKAHAAAVEAGLQHVEFRDGYAEALPVPDLWTDVVISNGVVNLCPDKLAVFREMYRILKPGGRLQIGDILVQQAVPEAAKEKVEL
jgi:arsenite methyltransferase